jgi:hypothetical protein
MKRNFYISLFLIFVLSILFRTGLFYEKWDNLRHGSAAGYGSVAIGLFNKQGLTFNLVEVSKIEQEENNHSGNYLRFYEGENRKKFIEFLPGPAILLSLVWKIIPLYNFAPYIWLQIFLDSILILLFYLIFKSYDNVIALVVAIFMIFNVATVKRTLTMGYDFWPQFCVLVNFVGITVALGKEKNAIILFLTGILTALTVWFREIANFLPFCISILLFLYFGLHLKFNIKHIVFKVALYLLPVMISLGALSMYRYSTTGNLRPTRSTFWHSFFAGVGQFSNPYGLRSLDSDISEFAKRSNKKLENWSGEGMAEFPNSIYETTLRKEAFHFVTEYPFLFIRNTFYRICIMISPFLYVPKESMLYALRFYLLPVKVLSVIFWLLGLCYIYRKHNLLFWLSSTIYLYFFLAFGWFYVVGSVFLSFFFINIFIYLFGIKSVILNIRLPIKLKVG